MKKVVVALLLFFLCLNMAQAKVLVEGALTDAFLRYKTVGWQTYEFFVLANVNDTSKLNIEWTVDDKDVFNAEKLHYFFKPGDHAVRVRVEDKFGNIRYDKVKLEVRFWSFQDNWFWWILYALLVCVVVYYWTAKIIYILNRRKVAKQVRYFLDALDEHGWVERAIEAHFKVQDYKIGTRLYKKTKKVSL